MTGSLLFTLRLRHLSADGKQAGTHLPNAQLPHVSVKQLESLLQAMERLAPTVAYPVEPEMRIAGNGGEFVVQVKAGQLKLVSWSSAHRTGVATPSEIIAIVSGEGETEPVARGTSRAASPASRVKDRLVMVALGAAILAVNSFTVWFVTRPPRTLAPKYTLLSPERSARVLDEISGTYETGRAPGDRRLEIRRDASGLRIKLGAGGAPRDKQEFTVKPAEAGGKTALVTSRKALITVEDPLSLALYGDKYTRVRN